MYKKYLQARELRQNMTSQEYKLWALLRNRNFNGVKFVRQYPIGHYIVDFACRKKRIVLELDGGQHNEMQNKIYDDKRTEYLISKGYKVLRFWNNEIDDNLEGVYLKLLDFVKEM